MNSFPVFPEQASNWAVKVDSLYFAISLLTIIFSIIVFVPTIALVMRYRVGTRADRSHPHHHNLKLELTWTLLPLLLAFPIFAWSAWLFIDMYRPIDPKVSNALDISVVGKQWMWHIQHPTGQRENDELHIPLGRPVRLHMISQDVLHSFYIPAFRTKKDVVPGRYSESWFIPTKVGKYHLFCAEFCGTKHSEMIGSVYVLEPADYEAWLKNNRWGMNNLRKQESTAEMGERIFAESGCTNCHGHPDNPKNVSLMGIAGTQRRLTDGRVVEANDEYLRRSIYEPDTQILVGHEPLMPSYKGRLDEQQVMQLIAYLKSMRPEVRQDAPPGGPAANTEQTR